MTLRPLRMALTVLLLVGIYRETGIFTTVAFASLFWVLESTSQVMLRMARRLEQDNDRKEGR